MFVWGVDHEIWLCFARAMDFGSNARIVGDKRAVGQARPKASDGFVETRRARGIDAVIFCFHPFEVGAEARGAAKVTAIVRS